MPSRKGSPDRIGAGVKSNVIGVFEKIGGREAMATWAQENLTEFYRLYARLIPSEVTATIDIRDARELSDSELSYIASGGGPRDVVETPGPNESDGIH